MNKIVCLMFAILLLVTGIYAQEMPDQKFKLEFAWQMSIAKKEKKNIKDYFLLLPSEFIDCEGAQFGAFSTEKKREEFIKEVDLKNGYLVFGGKAQLVLFKDRKNEKDIIAIQVGGCGAGNTCGALNTVMELKDAVWKFRVDLLPQGISLEEAYYEELRSDIVCPYFDLPQIGTTILVRNECLVNECKPRSIVAKYLWTGERFINED